MNIAIASYSFHGLVRDKMMDVFGYLETCKHRYGLQTADIWNGMLPTTDEEFLLQVKEALTERELTLVNLCVDQAHIWEDDPDAREQNYQNALGQLSAAKFLNAKTIRIDAGCRADTWNDEQFDLIVTRYREWAQFAYDNGFKVGPENHWGAENDPKNMVKLCKAVDHPGFGILLHFKDLAGDKMMAPWAVHTHMSWDCVMNTLDESMKMLADAGYEGCWGIEYHSAQNEYSQVAVQVAMVRDVLERWRTGE